MKISIDSRSEDLTVVHLEGRLDIDGSRAVEDKFAFATTTHQTGVIVDLSGLSFLASIGIRMLMSAARGQHGRGGKVVLAAPQESVRKVLEVAGIDQLIPLYADLASAEAALMAA